MQTIFKLPAQMVRHPTRLLNLTCNATLLQDKTGCSLTKLKSYSYIWCQVYGDMGYTNAVSLNRLIQEVNKGGYDAVIHVGGTVSYCSHMRDFARLKCCRVSHKSVR